MKAVKECKYCKGLCLNKHKICPHCRQSKDFDKYFVGKETFDELIRIFGEDKDGQKDHKAVS